MFRRFRRGHRQPWRHYGSQEYCQNSIVPGCKKTWLLDGNYYCFEEDCDAPVAIRELLDKGLYTAPVNDYFKPGEYEKAIDRSLQEYHPDYWQARENTQARHPEKRKERER